MANTLGTRVRHAVGDGETFIANGLTGRYGKGTDSDATDTMIAATLSHGSNPNSNMAGRRREDDYNLVAGPLGGGNDGIGRRSEDDPNRVASFAENQRGELVETSYAHQLTSGGGKPGQGYSAVREGAYVRRLTPTECERLQALPDGWTQPGPDSRRYAGLGDAVTSSVGEWIGRRIIQSDEVDACEHDA